MTEETVVATDGEPALPDGISAEDLAQAKAELAPEGEAPPEAEKTEDVKQPLPPEEVAKRLEDQKLATKAERAKRRQIEASARASEQAMAERLAALEARITQQTAVDSPPDPSQDPEGALRWMTQKIFEREQQEMAGRQEQAQAQQANQQLQQVINAVTDFEAEFSEDHPDYQDAVQHLKDARRAELLQIGYHEGNVDEALQTEVLQIAAQLVNQGRNPAEAAYALAQQRGFAPKRDDIQRIAAGMQASKTLGSSGGSSGEMTMESIANLDGAAFDSAYAKFIRQERERERRTA